MTGDNSHSQSEGKNKVERQDAQNPSAPEKTDWVTSS